MCENGEAVIPEGAPSPNISEMQYKINEKVLCYGEEDLIFNARVYLLI
jgi:hypothetical protein